MKYLQYITLIFCLALCACNDVIDLYPASNLNTDTYYKTEAEVRTGLNGCYNGLQRPMYREWQFTELRSDNSKQGETGSQSSVNRDLSDLDMFFPSPNNQAIYLYWLDSYNNIYNANIILQKLGVTYDPAAGTNTLGKTDVIVTDSVRKQLAGEALFIRGYHYFNLVRLFGGVFIVHNPVTATEAKGLNRSSVNDMYKIIEADLVTASSFLSAKKVNQIAANDVGRVTRWAAKALLGKVYLTLNRKTDAITQLTDVQTNSGHALQASYANVFSVNTEMNSEIIFAIRYRAGGLGLGSSFGNDFAAASSGATIINGSGQGWNYPTNEFDTAFITTRTPLTYDARRDVNIGFFGANKVPYIKKYISPVVLLNDGESDWPVLRYADVLLLLAEAQGYTPASISLINQIRTRVGLPNLPATVNTVALFEQALSNERRLEFAFENQRHFDLIRFNKTLTTITAEQTIKDHFAKEYAKHYANYPAPRLTLAELQSNVNANRLLLPIPQREIDTNTGLKIEQNPGY